MLRPANTSWPKTRTTLHGLKLPPERTATATFGEMVLYEKAPKSQSIAAPVFEMNTIEVWEPQSSKVSCSAFCVAPPLSLTYFRAVSMDAQPNIA